MPFPIVKTWFQHIQNPLHIYCRLLDLRIRRQIAWKITRRYEALSERFRPDLGITLLQGRATRERWRNGKKGAHK